MTSFGRSLQNAKKRGRRLSHYLEQHYDEVAAEWAKVERRDLTTALAAVLALGLVDDRGKAPNAQTLTRTWKRIVDRRSAEAERPPSPQSTFVRVTERPPRGEAQARQETPDRLHEVDRSAGKSNAAVDPADSKAIARAKLAAARGAAGRTGR